MIPRQIEMVSTAVMPSIPSMKFVRLIIHTQRQTVIRISIYLGKIPKNTFPVSVKVKIPAITATEWKHNLKIAGIFFLSSCQDIKVSANKMPTRNGILSFSISCEKKSISQIDIILIPIMPQTTKPAPTGTGIE